MTLLHRLAPALVSSVVLLAPFTSYAEDSINSGLDAGSEMFTDTVDIGSAFGDAPAPTKEYSGSNNQAAERPQKMKMAKAKKAKKPHAARKTRKKSKKAQKTKKTHKAKAHAGSDDAAGAHAAAAATPVQSVSQQATSPVAAVAAAAVAPAAAVVAPVAAAPAAQPAALSEQGSRRFLGSMIGGAVLLILGAAVYFMRKKSQSVEYDLGAVTNHGSAISGFTGDANVFTSTYATLHKKAHKKPAKAMVSAPAESFVSNI